MQHLEITTENIPIVLYFKDKSTHLPSGVIDTLQAMGNYKFEFCDSWPTLLLRLQSCSVAQCPSLILVDSRLFILQNLSISEFIDMISIMQKTVEGINKKISIGVSIPKSCTLDIIDKLKVVNIIGIVPYAIHFGFHESSTALGKLTTGEKYWPDHIIAQLPVDQSVLPLVITYRSNWEAAPTVTKLAIGSAAPLFRWQVCEKWRDLCDAIHLMPDLIMFHQDMVGHSAISPTEFVSMISNIIKINQSKAKIAVVIEGNCEKDFLNELRLTDVAGIVPSVQSFGQPLSIGAVEILLSGKPYWPKNIIENLVGTKQLMLSHNKGIHLTDRQTQVLSLVCKRGLSNKKIASTLHISESTVKIHVSAILKEYGVRNRTQLVLAALPAAVAPVRPTGDSVKVTLTRIS